MEWINKTKLAVATQTVIVKPENVNVVQTVLVETNNAKVAKKLNHINTVHQSTIQISVEKNNSRVSKSRGIVLMIKCKSKL